MIDFVPDKNTNLNTGNRLNSTTSPTQCAIVPVASSIVSLLSRIPLLGFEKKNRTVAEVKVDEMLRLC